MPYPDSSYCQPLPLHLKHSNMKCVKYIITGQCNLLLGIYTEFCWKNLYLCTSFHYDPYFIRNLFRLHWLSQKWLIVQKNWGILTNLQLTKLTTISWSTLIYDLHSTHLRKDYLWISMFNGSPVSLLGAKWPGHVINHPPLSSKEVKERVGLYLLSPFGPSWPIIGWNLPLPCAFMFNICTRNQSCYSIHAQIVKNREESKIANIRLVNFRTSKCRAASILTEPCVEIAEVGWCIPNKLTADWSKNRPIHKPTKQLTD